jgi:hypothetical protein
MSPLEDELRALGRSAVLPPVDKGLAAAVLEAVEGQPVRRSPVTVLLRRWRAFLALLAVLVGGAVVVSPVRATVAEWLNIGGVKAQPVGQAPSAEPTVPPVQGHLSLEDAGRIAGFAPTVPKVLGPPSRVEASQGFVAMSWSTGERLEQFGSQLDWGYLKQYHGQLDTVDAVNGLWFEAPYELKLVDGAGQQKTLRVAGPTLVWAPDNRTFRLEGVKEKARATEVALSATP